MWLAKDKLVNGRIDDTTVFKTQLNVKAAALKRS